MNLLWYQELLSAKIVPVTLFQGVIGQTGSNFVSEGLGVDLGSWCSGVLVILGMMLWCYG